MFVSRIGSDGQPRWCEVTSFGTDSHGQLHFQTKCAGGGHTAEIVCHGPAICEDCKAGKGDGGHALRGPTIHTPTGPIEGGVIKGTENRPHRHKGSAPTVQQAAAAAAVADSATAARIASLEASIQQLIAAQGKPAVPPVPAPDRPQSSK